MVEGDALVDADGEGFLMGVFLEDIALPVDPRIQLITRQIQQQLEAHLRVLR